MVRSSLENGATRRLIPHLQTLRSGIHPGQSPRGHLPVCETYIWHASCHAWKCPSVIAMRGRDGPAPAAPGDSHMFSTRETRTALSVLSQPGVDFSIRPCFRPPWSRTPSSCGGIPRHTFHCLSTWCRRLAADRLLKHVHHHYDGSFLAPLRPHAHQRLGRSSEFDWLWIATLPNFGKEPSVRLAWRLVAESFTPGWAAMLILLRTGKKVTITCSVWS